MSLHARGPLSQNIIIQDDPDILIAFGTKLSGELLRTLGEPTPPGIWFRVVKIDENGVATVEQKREEVKS